MARERLNSAASSRLGPIDPFDADDEDIQISLAPYVQTLLARAGLQRRRRGLWGRCCPVAPFERAAAHHWWDPRFDSPVLERQYRQSSFPQTRLRFRYALLYSLLVSLGWLVYTLAVGIKESSIPIEACIALIFHAILMMACLLATHSRRRARFVAVAAALGLITLSLTLAALNTFNKLHRPSSISLFSLAVEIILAIYTVIPLPLYLAILVTTSHSIGLEIFAAFSSNTPAEALVVRALTHICVHLIGVHILIMTQVRMRGTFMKVGQSLLVRRQLEKEKQIKEKMIHSVMPPKLAECLMKEHTEFGDSNDGDTIRDFRSLFRPFNMHRMSNVSILFADVVGFTRMSSNKTAEQLVDLLNDLFERFDLLCEQHELEKISTLGDCYYCVAGCPEPMPDHAHAAVQMGLDMIRAIAEFDRDRNEDVKMRVGVHTGTVLCGIVGTCRIKFDVWSNDVSFANQMESSGRADRVHISQTTRDLIGDNYLLEEGQEINGLKTYYIRDGRPSSGTATPRLTTVSMQRLTVPMFARTPPPKANNTRPRVASSFMHIRRAAHLQGTKANSLPSILDTENDIGVSGNGSAGSGAVNPPSRRIPPWRKADKVADEMVSFEITTPTPNTSPTRILPPIVVQSDSVGPESSLDRMSSIPGASGPEDDQSICLSVYSRKDSGIRSNSRRSSIQQQIFLMNGLTQGDLLNHRVSGYYTSSQSSLEMDETGAKRPSALLGETLPACFNKLRKQSDLQLIRCVQDNITSHRSYFVKPPLSRWTLRFNDSGLEEEYRHEAHRILTESQEEADLLPPTLATSRFNTGLDVFIDALVYLVVATGVWIILTPPPPVWIGITSVCLVIELVAIILCALPTHSGGQLLARLASSWYAWHACGSFLVSIPAVIAVVGAAYSHYTINKENYEPILTLPVLVSLLHFCNFTQLNCWAKNCLATIFAFIFLAITNTDPQVGLFMIFLLILIWFLNREFEISYRLSFHGNSMAAKDRAKVQKMKNQADWLLHNIIPKHVADQLKKSACYSENHSDVGIIFASIVNFNEMYDESYLGGKEYLRVLNELIGDFDELLTRSEFSNIEKIKTIGSTFMAASGLNPEIRSKNISPYQHLFQLIEFALAMQQVIDAFNCELLEFNLELRVGYNHGDVTAGVIGTSKLYYDIWGDAVNIASRMDSTGVKGRIQLGAHCVPTLKERFILEHRGQVFVKGKDNMDVYLISAEK